MLQVFKKWFGQAADAVRPGSWRDIERWAAERGCEFRPVRDVRGFVLEGRTGPTPWRVEWGPTQRSYVIGQELRIRAELNLPKDLQALILSRELQESMERDVFDQYVEGVQTRVDTQTPPEMRWLVMFPRLSGQELRGLRERWAAVSSFKPWLLSWLDGALSQALAEQASASKAREPLALMLSRGKLVLRTGVEDPTPAVLQGLLALFETALREAGRAAADFGADAGGHSTHPSLWAASAMPDGSTVH